MGPVAAPNCLARLDDVESLGFAPANSLAHAGMFDFTLISMTSDACMLDFTLIPSICNACMFF